MAAGMGSPARSSMPETTMAAKATTGPTDRSMPPVRITTSMPRLMSPLVTICRSRLLMLRWVKNTSDSGGGQQQQQEERPDEGVVHPASSAAGCSAREEAIEPGCRAGIRIRMLSLPVVFASLHHSCRTGQQAFFTGLCW